MINSQELITDLFPGENVQVIVTGITPMTGKIKEIRDSYILLEPYKDEKLAEVYGESVITETFVPFTDLALIFKLTHISNGNKDEGKEKDNNSNSSKT